MTSLPPLTMSPRTANHFATCAAARDRRLFSYWPSWRNTDTRTDSEGHIWPRTIIDPKPQENRP